MSSLERNEPEESRTCGLWTSSNLLGARKKCKISGPISNLLSQSLLFTGMICVHIMICTDFEERAMLLGTRTAKLRWLKRWLKISWLLCQRLLWSNSLPIGSQSRLGIWLTIYKYTFPHHTPEIEITLMWGGTQESPFLASTGMILLELVGIWISYTSLWVPY